MLSAPASFAAVVASLVAALLLLFPSAALAGGFGISEFGSRESGRGSAAVALHDDPSAVFYNPANVSLLSGVRVSLGAAGIMPRWQYTPLEGGEPVRSELGITPPPHFSLTYGLGEPGIGELGIGVGFYVPYGAGFSWPESWAGADQIERIALNVYELTPVVAWRPSRSLAVGAGLRYVPATVYMEQAVRFGAAERGKVEFAGSGHALGASAGLSFFPTEGLSIGATWRSPVHVAMSGQANFEFPPPFDADAVDSDVRTTVPLAQIIRLGVAWDALPGRLNVSADVEYQRWRIFRSMDLIFVNEDGTEEVSRSPRNSQDCFTLHAGGEWRLDERISLRAGYIFDPRTLPEETVNPAPPDSDKHVFSVGGSYQHGRYGLHLHFANAFFARRTSATSEFPGQWEGGHPGGTVAYLFGLSLSASFDPGAPFPNAASIPAVTLP